MANVSVLWLILGATLGALSLVANVLIAVRLAVVSAELHVLREVLTGKVAPPAKPFDFDKLREILAFALPLAAQLLAPRPPAPPAAGA